MFHRYVLNSNGERVDIDRAHYLMDKKIRHSCLFDLNKYPEASIPEQVFWDKYCQKHLELYNEPFLPDVEASCL